MNTRTCLINCTATSDCLTESAGARVCSSGVHV